MHSFVNQPIALSNPVEPVVLLPAQCAFDCRLKILQLVLLPCAWSVNLMTLSAALDLAARSVYLPPAIVYTELHLLH